MSGPVPANRANDSDSCDPSCSVFFFVMITLDCHALLFVTSFLYWPSHFPRGHYWVHKCGFSHTFLPLPFINTSFLLLIPLFAFYLHKSLRSRPSRLSHPFGTPISSMLSPVSRPLRISFVFFSVSLFGIWFRQWVRRKTWRVGAS